MLELDLLDAIPGGYMALYRTKVYPTGGNDAFEVKIFSCSGQTLAASRLNPHFSRRDQLEVQDVRYADRVVYFNEACQGYSRDAGGRCSALVALDPFGNKRLWRTGSLVSNSVMRVTGSYVITGYGFTAERDFVRVVRRSDGKVLDKQSMPSSHFEMEQRGDVMNVEVGGSWVSYRMVGFAGTAPKLQPLGARTAAAPVAIPALPMWPFAPAPKQAAAGAWLAPWIPTGALHESQALIRLTPPRCALP